MPLAPCPQCARHVRLPTSPCPFCGGDTALARPARAWLVSSSRFTRAAIFAGAALTVGACTEAEEAPAAAGTEEAAGEAGDEEPEMAPMVPSSPAMEPVMPVPTDELEEEGAAQAIGSSEDEEEADGRAGDEPRRRRRRRRRVDPVPLRADPIDQSIDPPYGAPPLRAEHPV